ncbi:metalloprotease TldD [Methylophilaceae bacterium]|jgi:TldD protein|nr:metalloprotease TldD [Nitrosomonadales bacterium]MCH9770827.1 metalloprotease TldD [Betaproteobacteria bacterium]MDA9086455.1 metalloprotease TldD [Methylophilaceae bacterium]
MQDFQLSNKFIINKSDLSHHDLLKYLDTIKSKSVDYSDIYFQYSKNEFWSLEDGVVKNGSFSIDQGVGLRSISGEQTAFTYSDDISNSSIKAAVQAIKSMESNGNSAAYQIPKNKQSSQKYTQNDPIESINNLEKIKILESIDSIAKSISPLVTRVSASLASSFDVVLIQNHFGKLVEDIRPLVRLSVSVIVESKKRREQGSSGGGGRYNLTYFDNHLISKYAKEAVDNALINLEAEASPAGSMTVVLGSGWPGILLHEAIGHGLEGDFNRKGTSAFSNKMGQQVASKGITIVDDGTIKDRRGSLNYDDEGNETKNTTLIEDGKLVGYIQDAQNAKLMNMNLTGNGRRESYAHLPMPRMTNTYMLNGNHSKEEIITSVKNGLYASNFGGGQVDITSGKFVFSASEAYLIKDGRISHPVKGATIIGNGPDILKQVSMVGNDMSLDSGVGTCGKDGQSVPVGVGQPTLKIDNIVVGGTN